MRCGSPSHGRSDPTTRAERNPAPRCASSRLASLLPRHDSEWPLRNASTARRGIIPQYAPKHVYLRSDIGLRDGRLFPEGFCAGLDSDVGLFSIRMASESAKVRLAVEMQSGLIMGRRGILCCVIVRMLGRGSEEFRVKGCCRVVL
jgi:hypothetical protein